MTMKNDFKHKRPISIVDLFPDLTTEEQAGAEYAFKQYLYLVWRICERLSAESPALLTHLLREANVKEQNRKSLRPTRAIVNLKKILNSS